MSATVLVGSFEACNMLINNLAWAGATPATADPAPTKKTQVTQKR